MQTTSTPNTQTASGFHATDFPFEEIRMPNGDYWATAEAAIAAGFAPDQVWSVCESGGVFCYGPSHHRINVIGFVATKEAHDGTAYYECADDLDEELDD